MEVWSQATWKQSPLCSCRDRVVILASLFFTLLVVSVASAQVPFTVEWQRGRLSILAEKMSLSQIVREIAHRTGMQVQGLEELEAEVSVHFADLPLREGLQKLLAQENYLLLEEASPQGGTRRVLSLLGRRALSPPEAIPSEEGAKPTAGAVAEEDQQERLTALYASAAQGDEEALRQAFFDPDQTIQATALELLAQRNRQGATTLLVDATKSEQPETRFQALRLLHQTGQADAETVRSSLNEALADEDMTVRGYAIQALAEQRDPEAIESLRQAFSDPDPSIRLMVLENAMLKEGGRLLLQEALADEAEAIRSLAAFWLEQASAERR